MLCQLLKKSFISDEKPTVECSFVTEFEDHIFVTVDAEAFFFLHDLIISYIREKNRVVCILNSCLLFSVFNKVKNEKKKPTHRLVLIPNCYLMRITIKILEYFVTHVLLVFVPVSIVF